MSPPYKFILAAVIPFASTSCERQTEPSDYLKDVFRSCQTITDGSAGDKTLHCNCVAKRVVATHSINELALLIEKPTELVDQGKARESVISCMPGHDSPELPASTTSAHFAGRHWQLIRTVGNNQHYVHMPEAYWQDLGEYRQAFSQLCSSRNAYCGVEFWKDIAKVPSGLPRSLEQSRTKIPIAVHYRDDGSVRATWTCESMQPKIEPCPPIKY